MNPKANDEFIIIYKKPVTTKKIHIETGHPSTKKDILQHGVLAISNTFQKGVEQTNCTKYKVIANFTEGICHLDLTQYHLPLKCLKILVTGSQDDWLVIHKIYIQN